MIKDRVLQVVFDKNRDKFVEKVANRLYAIYRRDGALFDSHGKRQNVNSVDLGDMEELDREAYRVSQLFFRDKQGGFLPLLDAACLKLSKMVIDKIPSSLLETNPRELVFAIIDKFVTTKSDEVISFYRDCFNEFIIMSQQKSVIAK